LSGFQEIAGEKMVVEKKTPGIPAGGNTGRKIISGIFGVSKV
jgi:hypothetical protein